MHCYVDSQGKSRRHATKFHTLPPFLTFPQFKTIRSQDAFSSAYWQGKDHKIHKLQIGDWERAGRARSVGELRDRQDCTESGGVLRRERGTGHHDRLEREDYRAGPDRCPAQWRFWLQFQPDTGGSVDVWEDIETGQQAVDPDGSHVLPPNTHFGED